MCPQHWAKYWRRPTALRWVTAGPECFGTARLRGKPACQGVVRWLAASCTAACSCWFQVRVTEFGDPTFEAPLVRGRTSTSSCWAMSLTLRIAQSSSGKSLGAWSTPKLLCESRGNLWARLRVSASLRHSALPLAAVHKTGFRDWGLSRQNARALSFFALCDLERL